MDLSMQTAVHYLERLSIDEFKNKYCKKHDILLTTIYFQNQEEVLCASEIFLCFAIQEGKTEFKFEGNILNGPLSLPTFDALNSLNFHAAHPNLPSPQECKFALSIHCIDEVGENLPKLQEFGELGRLDKLYLSFSSLEAFSEKMKLLPFNEIQFYEQFDFESVAKLRQFMVSCNRNTVFRFFNYKTCDKGINDKIIESFGDIFDYYDLSLRLFNSYCFYNRLRDVIEEPVNSSTDELRFKIENDKDDKCLILRRSDESTDIFKAYIS